MLMIYLNKTEYIPLVEPDIKQIFSSNGMTFSDSAFKEIILTAVGTQAITNDQRRACCRAPDKLMFAWTFK